MTFLAEVVSVSRLGQKAKARLLGKKRPDGLWMGVKESNVDLPYSRTWSEKQLLLLELNGQGQVEEVACASDRLRDALKDWSLRLSRFDSDKINVELLKKSLEYQAAQLFKREEDLKRREELLSLQEEKLESLLGLAQEKLDAAAKQHEALLGAWEHLHYKEQQLKKE